MGHIPRNKPYNGCIAEHKLIESVPVKVYFTDIRGRLERELYEWGVSRIFKDNVSIGIEKAVHKEHIGIPHIAISFPHITTLFRWGDPRNSTERETNLHKVGSGKTCNGKYLYLEQPKYPFEIVCPLEGVILGEESLYWASALSIGDYLKQWVTTDIEVKDTNKLRERLKVL